LATLPREKWNLVWGPATRRAGDVFDSSAMYVVRSTQDPERYVVAVRGTNSVSLSDLLQGDFTVRTLVAWPFATDGAAVSTSTALGLHSLLAMRSGPPSIQGKVAGLIQSQLGKAAAAAEAVLPKFAARLPELDNLGNELTAQLNRLLAGAGVLSKIQRRLTSASKVSPQQIGPPTAAPARAEGETLFEFLSGQAAQGGTPLQVTVTGHSKGGALAPTLALWLKETQTSRSGARAWNTDGQATIGCVTFAGPTPGNAAFAQRIEAQLQDHHRIANTNDIVTHGWEEGQLKAVGQLYGKQSAPFKRLFDAVADDVAGLDYRHAQTGVLTFAGAVDPNRTFVPEAIHQHLDAYLERFGPFDPPINTFTFFR
jgi:hypothetical protein